MSISSSPCTSTPESRHPDTVFSRLDWSGLTLSCFPLLRALPTKAYQADQPGSEHAEFVRCYCFAFMKICITLLHWFMAWHTDSLSVEAVKSFKNILGSYPKSKSHFMKTLIKWKIYCRCVVLLMRSIWCETASRFWQYNFILAPFTENLQETFQIQTHSKWFKSWRCTVTLLQPFHEHRQCQFL